MLTKQECLLLKNMLEFANIIVMVEAGTNFRNEENGYKVAAQIDQCLAIVQRELDEIKPIVEPLVSDTYDLAGA